MRPAACHAWPSLPLDPVGPAALAAPELLFPASGHHGARERAHRPEGGDAEGYVEEGDFAEAMPSETEGVG